MKYSRICQRNDAAVQLTPSHIVMATGVLGGPYIPEFAHRDRFPGPVLHTTQYTDPTPYAGKRVAVVRAEEKEERRPTLP